MTTGFSYSLAQSILENAKSDPKDSVKKMGALCVKTDTSIAEVADFFGVSRQSVYGWLSGNYQPADDKLKKVDKFIAKLEKKLGRKTATTA